MNKQMKNINSLSKLNLLQGINQEVINNGVNDFFAQAKLKQFTNETIESIDYSKSYKYFFAEFPNDLFFYKQSKKSGYNYIALYKKTTIVGIGDFMTKDGKEIKSNLIQSTDHFFTYSIFKLKKAVLKKYFSDIWDHRCRYPKFKPSVDQFWIDIEPIIFNNSDIGK